MVTRRRAAGFTLMELMVTIAIMAFLLLAGLPFMNAWVDGVRQMQARNQLLDGIGQARALALRNPASLAADQPVAMLRMVGREAQVVMSPAGTTVWTAQLHEAVVLNTVGKTAPSTRTLKHGNDARFRCVAFNSRGIRLPNASNCILPLTIDRIAIVAGKQDPIHVELL